MLFAPAKVMRTALEGAVEWADAFTVLTAVVAFGPDEGADLDVRRVVGIGAGIAGTADRSHGRP